MSLCQRFIVMVDIVSVILHSGLCGGVCMFLEE